MADPGDTQAEIETKWRETLTHGHSSKLAFLPSSPRCSTCGIPFGGVGGTALKLFGRRSSRKNPNLCNYCDEIMPSGGAEIDIAVLFADVRGSTGLGERMGATAFAALLNRFYRVATDALIRRNAMIDKMVGDEVMALFIPATGPEYRRRSVQAAVDLMRAVGYDSRSEPWLPLGVGVHAGLAYVGKVGTEGVNDFTALGDTVNTTARLQGEAKAGEILLSEAVYQDVSNLYPGLEQETRTLRGRDEAVAVRILRPAVLASS